MLHNVVLLDARFSEFRICGVDMSTSGKPTKPLLQNCNLMGIALHRRVNPRDYVDIKVVFVLYICNTCLVVCLFVDDLTDLDGHDLCADLFV